MLSKKLKDLALRQTLKRDELKQLVQKFVFIKSVSTKDKIRLNKTLFNKSLSKTVIRRRCVLTNRSRGIVTKYNISRVKLRELLHFGIIPGYKKSV